MSLRTMEPSKSPTNSRPSPDDKRKQSPPAFLDLADSVSLKVSLLSVLFAHFCFRQAARLGTNMPDMSAVRINLADLYYWV
jgi:hypothetical protein